MNTKIILHGGKTQFQIGGFSRLKIIVHPNLTNQVITVSFIDRMGLIAKTETLEGTGVVFNDLVGEYLRFYFDSNLLCEFEYELS